MRQTRGEDAIVKDAVEASDLPECKVEVDSEEHLVYAENNFFDNNLQDSDSSVVTITGTMAAGNHVAIESDSVDGSGVPQRSKLEVLRDDRLSTGALVLPGVPGFDPGNIGYEIVFWQELSPE